MAHEFQFSIVIPTYNRCDMLCRAINSVASQSYKNFEVIIVDDGNTVSDDVFNSYDFQITLIKNRTNRGAAESRNIGVRAAKGKYISFLDDDDEFAATFLNATHKVLEESLPEVAYCWSAVEHCYYDAQDLSYSSRNQSFASKYKNKEKLFESALSIGLGYGVTVKREALFDVGLLDVRYTTVEDTELFIKLLLNNHVPAVVPTVGVKIHHHNRSRMTGLEHHSKRITECKMLLSSYKGFFKQYPTLRKQLEMQIVHLSSEIEEFGQSPSKTKNYVGT
ncbi:glycosyltransferase family 2 protein [Pseudoalteromonas maricaloris]|uniref:glycosyltransferase family 2 protein n=1 Tax=Pseudoalteromonas maricaloris TaxID=184924 RepID=UPI003C1586B9